MSVVFVATASLLPLRIGLAKVYCGGDNSGPDLPPFFMSVVFVATASLLPLRIGLAKVYCGGDLFWNEDGHSTTPTILEGI